MSILDAVQTVAPARAMPVAAERFETLDSWRGICALLVALFHFPAAGWLEKNGFINGSFLFVDFFFVLSGFVIAHAYADRLKDGVSLKRFMVTRFGRLFPLHAFMLAAFVVFEGLRMALPSVTGGGGRRATPVSPALQQSPERNLDHLE